MKRTAGIILIIVLILVLVIIGKRAPFGAGNSVFHVEKTDRISRFLISGAASSVELNKEGELWYVNGEAQARQAAVESLIRVISDIRIKSPVSEDALEEVLDEVSTQKIHVEIYSGMRLIQSFMIYLNESSPYPGIMRKREGAKAFFVHIPGYDTDPCKSFVPYPGFWTPHMIFALSPQKIEEIHFRYYNAPDSSFSIHMKEGELSLQTIYHDDVDIDTASVGRYLSYFTYVPFEKWASDLHQATRDSIRMSTPYFSLGVITDDEDTVNLTTWTRIINRGDLVTEDTDRLWGSMDGGKSLFVIRYFDLDPLIKGPSYFISD